jgi:hypothetical protein
VKTLVAGWFSFDKGHATAGDLMVCELACEWLEQASCQYDIALAPPFYSDGSVNWRSVNPKDYEQVMFVCGPFQKYSLELEFLEYFKGCRIVGLDLTLPVPLEEWNPFDLVFERDSSRATNPDLAFLCRQPRVPVVGVCLVEPYIKSMVDAASAMIHKLVNSRHMAVVLIDTRLDANSTGLLTPPEVEALIARMDVVVTTRLHGMVLALKNGVPAIAIDPEAGGAKIRHQAQTIGWDVVFNVDSVSDTDLQKAFDDCLSEQTRQKARECGDRAIEMATTMREKFLAAMAELGAKNSVPTETERRSRIQTTNNQRFDLETYPPTYLLEERQLQKPQINRIKAIAQQTIPFPIRRRIKSFLIGH